MDLENNKSLDCGCDKRPIELPNKVKKPRDIQFIKTTSSIQVALVVDPASIALSLGLSIAGAIAERLTSQALDEFLGADPVELSNDALGSIAVIIAAEIDRGRREDYENLVWSAHEKFEQWRTSDNDDIKIGLINNIISSNTDALTGLRNLGPGAISAWTIAVNNILLAYLLIDDIQGMKGVAERQLETGMVFLHEAREFTAGRVTRCQCEGDIFHGWDCCYCKDKTTVKYHYQDKDKAYTRCMNGSRNARQLLIEQMNALVFNHIEATFKKWEEISHL